MTPEPPDGAPPIEPSVGHIDDVVRAIQAKEAAAAGSSSAPAAAGSSSAPAPPRPAPPGPGVDRRTKRVGGRGPIGGLIPRLDWERLVADEAERQHRYQRPASVVLVDIDGLGGAVDRAGPGVVTRVAGPCGETLAAIARASDRIARLHDGRFGILLRETDADGARRYAARAVTACDPLLAAYPWPMQLRVAVVTSDGADDLVETLRRTEHAAAPRPEAAAER